MSTNMAKLFCMLVSLDEINARSCKERKHISDTFAGSHQGGLTCAEMTMSLASYSKLCLAINQEFKGTHDRTLIIILDEMSPTVMSFDFEECGKRSDEETKYF